MATPAGGWPYPRPPRWLPVAGPILEDGVTARSAARRQMARTLLIFTPLRSTRRSPWSEDLLLWDSPARSGQLDPAVRRSPLHRHGQLRPLPRGVSALLRFRRAISEIAFRPRGFAPPRRFPPHLVCGLVASRCRSWGSPRFPPRRPNDQPKPITGTNAAFPATRIRPCEGFARRRSYCVTAAALRRRAGPRPHRCQCDREPPSWAFSPSRSFSVAGLPGPPLLAPLATLRWLTTRSFVPHPAPGAMRETGPRATLRVVAR
jgi:hypothetical protein